MNFRELLINHDQAVISGPEIDEIKGFTDDSRAVESGWVFVAVEGEEVDGHRFIDKAIELGAAAIIAQRAPTGDEQSLAWAHLSNTQAELGKLSAVWNEHPSRRMPIVGVTGTNGKTTTTFLLHGVLEETLRRAGLSGTVFVNDGDGQVAATHTTPGAVVMHEMLGKMSDNDCRAVAMEVSSHGVEQGRIAGVEFDVAVFSNLTQDHLDYHGTMANYYQAKKKFFDDVAAQGGKKKPVAIINTDDQYGRELAREMAEKMKVVTYGFGVHADFRVLHMKMNPRGTEFQLDVRNKSYLVRMPLIGRFNVYNAVSALASAVAIGVPLRRAVASLENARQVPGRMEQAGLRSLTGTVFVDYAHTPDALENACRSLRELEPAKLITVFGCGGDRDSGKRPLMAAAAEKFSDFCIVTSDNPRGENPNAIIEQVKKGFKGTQYEVVPDRRKAIKAAVSLARLGDVVLIAGKGHEDYQIIGDKKTHFDDREEARDALAIAQVDAEKREVIKEAERAEKKARRMADRDFDRDREQERGKDQER